MPMQQRPTQARARSRSVEVPRRVAFGDLSSSNYPSAHLSTAASILRNTFAVRVIEPSDKRIVLHMWMPKYSLRPASG
jgi:hypothetical protein